jgi:uncharacterized membrane protein
MPATLAETDPATIALGRRVAPARFILFLVVTLAAIPLAAARVGWPHGSIVGFDVGAAIFLLSLIPLLKECSANEMRRHAAENDANRAVLLFIAGAVTVVTLVAVALELSPKGNPSPASIVLVIATLALSWLFTNSVFAMHYAHLYYLKDGVSGTDQGGIIFPETPEPNYWDFIYFSYCLGMTFQTADSNITSGRLRRIMTFHCMTAFVFNIGVIAFTINVLSSAGSR